MKFRQLHLLNIALFTAFSISTMYSQNKIGNTGKVGVGITNPVYILDVRDDESINDHEHFLGSFSHKTGKGVYLGYIGNGSNAKGGFIRTGGNIDLSLGTTKFNKALTIENSSGNIGVGITNPVYPFDVRYGESINDQEHLLSSFSHKSGKGVYLGYVGNGKDAKEGIIRTGGSINLSIGTTKFNKALTIENSSGNIGIGTTNPGYLLDVKKTDALNDKEYLLGSFSHNSGKGVYLGYIGNGTDAKLARVRTAGNIDLSFGTTKFTQAVMIKNATGNVGIGTSNPKNKLSVNGTIWAKEVKVSLTDAADWVFEADYKLQPLAEVEAFIKRNKHLPEMPSADEFRANDMKVSEMTNKLLQKIEELTLYAIEQNKQNEILKNRLEKLEQLIEKK